MTRLLLLCFLFIITASAVAQTSLAGKVTDQESGEPILFGNIVLYKNGVLTTGTETDFDGNYNFSNIDPGTYDLEVRYVGYQTQRLTGIRVLAGKANRADVQLTTEGVTLDEIVVKEYKIPLIEQDNTTSGGVITSEQIRNLPTRNINALAATVAGLSTSDEGGAINIRGSRSDATDYYLDGVRVQGALIQESEIEQLQVITGGMEAQYGDNSGGIISATSKGPSSTLSGAVQLETTNFFDAYDNSLIDFSLSGPLLKNTKGESILGFRVSGRVTDQLDDDPPGISVYRIKDEKLKELEANPILRIGSNPFVAADFVKANDVEALEAKPYEDSRNYILNAKLDARLGKGIDISLIGTYNDTKDQFTPGGWRVYNSHNNPFNTGQTYRGTFRLRHRLGGSNFNQDADNQQRKASLIQNASYTLLFTYEKTQGETYDQRHEDRFFDYGYVGQFDIDYVPTFVQLFDPATGQSYLQHTDYREVLRSYTPSATNQVLANYNNAMGIDFSEGLNGQINNYLITNTGNNGANVLPRAAFYAPNGAISGIYTSSWNFHTNVGTVYNNYSKGDNDNYTFNANASFDLVPGSSDKGRHNIQLGVWYEQRINRGYSVAPRRLWDIARQQANSHIQGIAENPDTVGTIDIPGFEGTPLLGVSIAPGAESQFYRRIRQLTGQALTDYVNVDGLSPDQLTLGLFSAKELNDQQIVSYVGYDYLGNPFDGTFEDFFTATDADGVRTFPVAPNRPIYSAAYIQDKFTFKDIIFRLGVRVDRYDANTKVLKDNYSLYDIIGAADYHTGAGSNKPGNIGDDYKVYLNDAGTSVTAYRDGDQWYRPNGTPANSPTDIDGIIGGLVFPKYVDQRAQRDPNFIKSREFDPSVSFEDYEVQVNVMPRLAFSFPISTEANFFAHYDILVQRPPTNSIATPRDYFYFSDISYNANNPINNPNLKPVRTTDYEVGFQQKLSNSSAIKIAAYYKEMRDLIQLRTFFPVPNVIQYTTYDNQDFGTIKGFSFTYDLRRTGNVQVEANYNLQFADGTGSNANSQRNVVGRGNLRTLYPLDYDERHVFNVNVDYRYDSGRFYNGPKLFGADIFANAGFNLQSKIVSGRPYTAAQTPTELGGVGTIGAINGARKPWTFVMNLRVDKSFVIDEKYGLNVYCRVSNLLDRRNIIAVYPVTGSANDDGFLASSFGEQQISNIESSVREVDSYLAAYQWALLNPNLYSLPRRIYVGAILDF